MLLSVPFLFMLFYSAQQILKSYITEEIPLKVCCMCCYFFLFKLYINFWYIFSLKPVSHTGFPQGPDLKIGVVGPEMQVPDAQEIKTYTSS
jgi:hypothetical protein